MVFFIMKTWRPRYGEKGRGYKISLYDADTGSKFDMTYFGFLSIKQSHTVYMFYTECVELTTHGPKDKVQTEQMQRAESSY